MQNSSAQNKRTLSAGFCLLLLVLVFVPLELTLPAAVNADASKVGKPGPASQLIAGNPDEAAARNPDSLTFDDLQALGQSLYLLDRKWQARAIFLMALTMKPASASAKAWFALSESDSARAHKEVELLLQSQSSALDGMVIRACAEQLEERYGSSIATCRKILATSPRHFVALSLICKSLLLNKSNRQCVAETDKLVEVYPKSAYAQYLSSRAQFAYCDFSKAFLAAQQAQNLSPNSLTYLAQKCACTRNSREKKSLKEILAPLDAATLASKIDPTAEFAEASALQAMGEPDLAFVHFERAAKLGSEDPYILLATAKFLLSEYGEVRRSKKLIEKARLSLPHSAIPYVMLAELAFLNDEPSVAENYLSAAASCAPQSVAGTLCKVQCGKRFISGKPLRDLCSLVLLQDPGNASAAPVLAEELAKIGKKDEAIGLLSKVISMNLANEPVLQSRAILYANRKQFEKASDDYAAVLDMNPCTGKWPFFSFAKDAYAGLAACFDKALAIRPHPMFYYRRFEYVVFNPVLNKKSGAYLAEGLLHCLTTKDFLPYLNFSHFFQNYRQLVDLSGSALKLNPSDDRVLVSLALGLVFTNENEKALQTARQALACAPDKPSTLTTLAYTCSKLNKQDEAVGLIKKAIRINPFDAGAYLQGASVYNKSGRLNEILKQEWKLLDFCPRNEQILENLVIWQKHPEDKLLKAAFRLLEVNPLNQLAYTTAFDCYKHLADTNACNRIMEQIDAQKFSGFEILKRKGELENLKTNYTKAIEYLSECVKIGNKEESSRMQVLQERAYSYYKLKRYQECLKDLDDYIAQASSNNSKLHRAYQTRGKVHFEMKNYAPALRDLTLAIQHANFPEGDYVRRAEVFLAMKKLEAAKADLKFSLKREPANSKAHEMLGKIFLLQGMKLEAEKEVALARKYASESAAP